MKAVLDTNVWLDWLVFDDPSSHELRRIAEAGGIELLATAATRAEWLDVISRPQFRLDEARRAEIAGRYDRHASIVDVESAGHEPIAAVEMTSTAPLGSRLVQLVCRDSDDQKFIDLALACNAPFLVSRDRELLRLARHARRLHGLQILTPEAPAWRATLAGCLARLEPHL